MATVLPVIALGLALALILPQLVRIARHRDATGISVGGLLSGTISFAAWLAYYLHLDETAAVVAMAGGGTAYLATTALAARFGGDRRGLAVPLVLTAVLAGAITLGGWDGLALALVTTVLWAYVPAVVSAWTAPTITGLSPLTWSLAAAYGAVWSVFGLDRTSVAITLNGILNLVLALGVLAAIIARRPRSAGGRHLPDLGPHEIHGVVLEASDDA